MSRLLFWINARFPLAQTWKKYATNYYVPKNLNVLYFFGSLATLVLINQLLTGLWLTMFYTPTAAGAFDSIEYIMRDVHYGWLLRYLHSTGASALFMVIYIHMFRALLYGSYQKPRELVWLLGMALFVLLLAEAFCGYLLPWGQMSYWGAQVVTSFLGAIPWVGDDLLVWLRGDFLVATPTLQRFFALHIIAIPLLLLIIVFLHIVALHHVGSNNPQGIDINLQLDEQGKPLDGIPFHPWYTVKDLLAWAFFLFIFFAVVFFVPDMGGYFLEPANFEPANPMVTPDSITPVWYMTPFYSILRTIPYKLPGIIAVVSAIALLVLIPWLDKSPVRSMRYKGRVSRWALALFVISFFILAFLGTMPVTPSRYAIAQSCVVVYFSYFLFMPLYSRFESCLPTPQRISK